MFQNLMKISGFVSGHGSSRTAKYSKINWGFTPCGMFGALKRLCVLATVAAVFFIPAPSFACSACRDISAGSSPQARAGLRKGILVLGIPAAGIFVGIIILAFKTKPNPEDSHPEQARQKDQHQV